MLNIFHLLSLVVLLATCWSIKLSENLHYEKKSIVDGVLITESRYIDFEDRGLKSLNSPSKSITEILDEKVVDVNENNINNDFSTMTSGNFYHFLSNVTVHENDDSDINATLITDGKKSDYFNWNDYGVVTPVMNQGTTCGSGWAFAVTGVLEANYAIKHKKLVSFSEQQLIECDKRNNGCYGGDPLKAYQSIADLGGIEREYDYTYTGYENLCNFKKSKAVANVKKIFTLQKKETLMKSYLLKHGPMAVTIDAIDIQYYTGGIHYPFTCDKKYLNHSMLLVGYGTKNGVDYWILKNSWGINWGINGYLVLVRGINACGIAEKVNTAEVY